MGAVSIWELAANSGSSWMSQAPNLHFARRGKEAVGGHDGGLFSYSGKTSMPSGLSNLNFVSITSYVFVFSCMMTSVTSEELIVILEEKLEQKLAPFKSTFDELKKTVEDNKELLNFTSKQYDTLLKRLSVCEDENKKLRNENKILQKTLNKLDTSLKSVTKANNDLEQYTRRECVEIRAFRRNRMNQRIQL